MEDLVKMLFCPKCGHLLMPKAEGRKTLLICNCGYKSVEKEDIVMKETIKSHAKFEVVDEKVLDVMPKTSETCPKCKHGEAYFWMMQTRAADEAETKFFQCVKCGHRWRVYK